MILISGDVLVVTHLVHWETKLEFFCQAIDLEVELSRACGSDLAGALPGADPVQGPRFDRCINLSLNE